MIFELKVPSIACEVCAKTITQEIQSHQPEAKVSVDVEAKTVQVETTASKEAIEKLIVAAGHEVAAL